MDIQKKESQTRKDYERAVFVLKTIENGKNYGNLAQSKTKQLHMLHNCIKRIGLKNEQIDKLSVIHVAGTKGKGSTCTFAEGILRNYGYRTGFFNSPHLLEVRERIMLDGEPVDEALFVSTFWHVYQRLHLTRAEHDGLMPGFFVFMLLMALHVFVLQEVDVVLLEVGIGGEYDATNFVKRPVVCGVTSMHVEHTDVLGNTIEEIAWHKSGIMKRGVPLVTVAHQDSVMAVILDRAKQKQCAVYLASALSEGELCGAELGIGGDVQSVNASLALQLCRLWRHSKGKALTSCDVNGVDDPSDVINVKRITHTMATELSVEEKEVLTSCDVNGVDDPSDVINVKRITHTMATELSVEEKEGLLSARLPGRSQVIQKQGVTYYVDGAHTTDSMQQCVTWFNESAQKEAANLGCKVFRMLVFRMKKDKPVKKLLPLLTKCGFRCLAFVPYVMALTDRQQFPDALDLGEDPHSAKRVSLSQLAVCKNLQEEEEDEDPVPLRPEASHHDALCFPSIISGLWWAGMAKDKDLQKMAMDDLASDKDLQREGPGFLSSNGPLGQEDEVHVQVLVTGSLALAGGVLAIIQPGFWL